jgi:hypothetical protein
VYSSELGFEMRSLRSHFPRCSVIDDAVHVVEGSSFFNVMKLFGVIIFLIRLNPFALENFLFLFIRFSVLTPYLRPNRHVVNDRSTCNE